MASDADILALDQPVYLMNVPLSLSSEVPNNIWMRELSVAERLIDRDKAVAQFFELYRTLTRFSLVFLLPSKPGLQDQTYVSNLGVVLPHLSEATVVLARFRAPARGGEVAVGRAFFERMNFAVESPPRYLARRVRHDAVVDDAGPEPDSEIFFEGEADLKYLAGNVYVGAHALRTSLSAHRWFSDTFNMEIIPFRMKHERLYHLDCCLMPMSPQMAAVCTAAADRSTIARIEKHVEILDISFDAATYGATNCLMGPNEMFYSSNVQELARTHPHYAGEKAKVRDVERMADAAGLETRRFNLSEFDKSGADLSCLVMNLNYRNYLRRSRPGSDAHDAFTR